MGIQINGQTDTISATDGSFTISGASGNLTGNLTGNVTGNLTGDVTGNLTGTASTATAAANAYGLSGSPTLSGITSVSTTNLTVNGTAYPSAGPLSNRNLIINGAMQVAQRGTSSTSAGYRTVDRFGTTVASLSATQTQESLSSGDPFNEGFRYFYRQENTSTSTASSARMIIYQRMEGQSIAQSGWNYTDSNSFITLSFWVRASVAQTYYVQLSTHNVGTQYNYPSSFSVSANTWTKVTKQIPGNSNLAFTNSNVEGLRVNFNAFLGTDRTDSGVSDNTWATYATGTQCPDMTSTWANTSNATFDITGVQLEVGSVATPFEHRSYGDELRRCERYFQVIKAIQAMSGGSSTIVVSSINLRTVMRSTPTWEQTGAFTFERSFYGGTTQTSASVTVYSAGSNTPYGSYLRFNNIPPTLPDNVGYYLNDSTDYLTASAEL